MISVSTWILCCMIQDAPWMQIVSGPEMHKADLISLPKAGFTIKLY